MSVNLEKIKEWLIKKVINDLPIESALAAFLTVLFGHNSLKLNKLFYLTYFKDILKIAIVFLSVLWLFKMLKITINILGNEFKKRKNILSLKKDYISFQHNYLTYFIEKTIIDTLIDKKLQKFELIKLDSEFFDANLSDILRYCEEEGLPEVDLHTKAVHFKEYCSPRTIKKAVDILVAKEFIHPLQDNLYEINDIIWDYETKIRTEKEKTKKKTTKIKRNT